MKSIFEFDDYRRYLRDKLKEMPRQGYGSLRRLAEHLQVHTTLVSQILKEKKQFTLDQAALCADFLHLNELETDFFVTLVHWDRAGNPTSRKWIERQKDRLRKQARELSQRVAAVRELNEEQQAVFYSSWKYSAIRQMTAIPGFDDLDAIARRLDLPAQAVRDCLDFLLSVGLVKDEKGKLRVGPSSTHLDRSSPWLRVHHANWRERGLVSLDQTRPEDLHYSLPLTIATKDVERVRERLLQAIESIHEIVDSSQSEELCCLTLDWFRIEKPRRS